MFWEKNYDFLAIGETTIDAFIRLKDASVHCNINNENCQLCVDFGAKIPFEFSKEIPAVGNGANASVSASRLGLSSALIANIGKDDNGKKCKKSLQKDGVGTEYLKINTDKETNYHYVLWYESERTILQKHSDFHYKMPAINKPKWIYLTSLGDNSVGLHNEISEYLDKNKDVKMAFQPGIFQIKWDREKIKNIYKQTEVFFCNVEEARTILSTEEHDIKKLMEMMAKLGPKKVFITDGIKGAYAYDSESNNAWFMPVYPHKPYERTGAGDAFASTVIAALALGKTLEESLMWGPINSMSVVQKIGAQEGLLTRKQIEDYLKKAPEDYKPQKI
ncbi:MAG TPA: carbohydrate kinase family protein [Candidatus Paceibacterota bacterium]